VYTWIILVGDPSVNQSFLFLAVWFRLKIQAKDGRTLQEKKRYLAFWLERFSRQEPGALLTAVFDMSESGLGNVVR